MTQSVVTGDRWAPDVAPGKAGCRRRQLETVYERFGKTTEALRVLSLCGAVPYTENALIQRRPDTQFDLVERDSETFKTLKACLRHEYPLVEKASCVNNCSLEYFLGTIQPHPYDVFFMDLMGGWSPQYARMFKAFIEKHSHRGSLIFFTYNSDWRFANSADIQQVYPLSELTTRYPLKILWQHSYSDSARHHNTMTTIAFEVTEDLMTEARPVTQHQRYQDLYAQGYRTVTEALGISRHAAGGLCSRARTKGIPVEPIKLECVILEPGKYSSVSMYSPKDIETLRRVHENPQGFVVVEKPDKDLEKLYAEFKASAHPYLDAGYRALKHFLKIEGRAKQSSISALLWNNKPNLEHVRVTTSVSTEMKLYSPKAQEVIIEYLDAHQGIVREKPTVAETIEIAEAVESAEELLEPELEPSFQAEPEPSVGPAMPRSSALELLKAEDPKLYRVFLAVAALMELGV